MILIYVLIGIIWIFLACVVLSALMHSSRVNHQMEDMEELTESGLVWNLSDMEDHAQITEPANQVMAPIEDQND